jgi:error-prone DNA polymerase
MSAMERLTTDYALQGHSTGKHPMALLRRKLSVISDSSSGSSAPADADSSPSDNQQVITNSLSPYRASELHALSHGTFITIGGLVICRQRPSTAKGHCFISLEDETGIANLFVPRATFQKYRLVITTERFLLCQGRIQISEGGQATLYTTHLAPLPQALNLNTSSHDFH